jgi:hypothetical protein
LVTHVSVTRILNPLPNRNKGTIHMVFCVADGETGLEPVITRCTIQCALLPGAKDPAYAACAEYNLHLEYLDVSNRSVLQRHRTALKSTRSSRDVAREVQKKDDGSERTVFVVSRTLFVWDDLFKRSDQRWQILRDNDPENILVNAHIVVHNSVAHTDNLTAGDFRIDRACLS